MTDHSSSDNGKPRKPPKKPAAPPARMACGPVAVGAVAGKVTRPLLGKRGLAEGDLLSHWESIVGSAVAAHALPERVKFPRGRRENGELVVRVASGPFAMQLQHDAPVVVERINAYFGYAAIRTLKLFQAPLPLRRRRKQAAPAPVLSAEEEADLSRTLDGITDPDLRAALGRLGRSMKGRGCGKP